MIPAQSERITGAYCKAASPLSTKVFASPGLIPDRTGIGWIRGEVGWHFQCEAVGNIGIWLTERRRRRVCTLGREEANREEYELQEYGSADDLDFVKTMRLV